MNRAEPSAPTAAPSTHASTAAGAARVPLRLDRFLLLAMFFGSGGAGLMYEVVWNRMLTLEMGSTAYALGTILTIFMGGLALGSYIAGRFTARIRNAVFVYGVLEVLIGAYCLALPFLIDGLHPAMRYLYNNFYHSFALFNLMQFALVGLVLIIPVTAMGATLPIVADYITRRRGEVSGSVGLCYAVNTIGAFLGCVLAGLVVLPNVGVSRTNFAAVSVSVTVGLLAILASRRVAPSAHLALAAPAGPSQEAPTQRMTTSGRKQGAPGASARTTATPKAEAAPADAGIPAWMLLAGFGVSGFAAMTYQIAWTRMIALSIGSATYAFTVIVSAFILGLALGAVAIGRLGDRVRSTAGLLTATQICLAVVAALLIPLLGELPVRIAVIIGRNRDAFLLTHALQFLVVFALVLAPTFLMGGMLPLVCKEIARGGARDVGAVVGRAYASNTVGTILGAFVAGFLLIPLIGVRGAIVTGVVLNAIVGGAFFSHTRILIPQLRDALAVFVGAAPIGVALAMPQWNPALITSAPYVYAAEILPRAGFSGAGFRDYVTAGADVVYFEEDVATTVTVTETVSRNQSGEITERTGTKYLHVGGKRDAGLFDATQSFLAHLPLTLHPKPEDVLVIGLGSGGTLSSAVRHDDVQRIDCVEISSGVRNAALEHFDRQAVLADLRVNMIIGDGRLHLAMTDRRYDCIISQPSNPWMVGASGLFTKDCFEEMRARLKPGGIACIWVQGFNVSTASVKILIDTFRSVFPEMDFWESRVGADYFLTGYLEPTKFDAAGIQRRMAQGRVREELSKVNILTAADFISYFFATGERLKELPGPIRISTDDHNLLEALIPREMQRNRWLEVLVDLTRVRQPPHARVGPRPDGGVDGALLAELQAFYDAKRPSLDLRLARDGIASQSTDGAGLLRRASDLARRSGRSGDAARRRELRMVLDRFGALDELLKRSPGLKLPLDQARSIVNADGPLDRARLNTLLIEMAKIAQALRFSPEEITLLEEVVRLNPRDPLADLMRGMRVQ